MLAGTAFAQTETGQITGKVTDPNGAVVAGAASRSRSVETGAQRTATTNDEGIYAITNLQPGVYEIAVQAANFAKSTQRVQVTVGAKASLDTTLSVSEISTATVNVIDSAGVEVNTQTHELSNVVSGTQIRELPTVTRNPYNLVQLSGNATTDDPSTSLNGTAGHRNLARRRRLVERSARGQHQRPARRRRQQRFLPGDRGPEHSARLGAGVSRYYQQLLFRVWARDRRHR